MGTQFSGGLLEFNSKTSYTGRRMQSFVVILGLMLVSINSIMATSPQVFPCECTALTTFDGYQSVGSCKTYLTVPDPYGNPITVDRNWCYVSDWPQCEDMVPSTDHFDPDNSIPGLYISFDACKEFDDYGPPADEPRGK